MDECWAETLQDYKAYYLPSFRTQERTQSQQQRHQWFNECGGLHIWNKVLGGQNPIMCSSGGQNVIAVFILEVGRLPVYRGSYQGNQQRVHPSPSFLIRTITNRGLNKHVGRSIVCVECGWSRHWSGRGCTEQPSWVAWWYNEKGITNHGVGSLVLLWHPFLLRPAERGTVLVTEDNTGSVHTPGTFLTGVCQMWTELPFAVGLEQKNAVAIIRDNLDDKKLPIRGKFPIEYQMF